MRSNRVPMAYMYYESNCSIHMCQRDVKGYMYIDVGRRRHRGPIQSSSRDSPKSAKPGRCPMCRRKEEDNANGVSWETREWGNRRCLYSPGVPYTIIHFPFFFSFSSRGGPDAPCSACFVCRSRRTSVVNNRSTFCAVLAEVSKKSQPKFRAI